MFFDMAKSVTPSSSVRIIFAFHGFEFFAYQLLDVASRKIRGGHSHDSFEGRAGQLRQKSLNRVGDSLVESGSGCL
jgi:hypothetical protein